MAVGQISEKMLEFACAALRILALVQESEQVLDKNAARLNGVGGMEAELAVQQPVATNLGGKAKQKRLRRSRNGTKSAQKKWLNQADF